jgi:hypothetical protein
MTIEQSVSKRRHIKFRCRGITQKEEYIIPFFAEMYNNFVQFLVIINNTEITFVFSILFDVVTLCKLQCLSAMSPVKFIMPQALVSRTFSQPLQCRGGNRK